MAAKKTTSGCKPADDAAARALIQWACDNIPKLRRPADVLEHILWFVCYEEAVLMSEDSIKGVARALRAGIGPYKTVEHLQEWLEGQDLDDVRQRIRDFWTDPSELP